MAEHNKFGQKGEEIARAFLEDKGYVVLEVNWRSGKGEIDIIAKKDQMIVFAEVKTRMSAYFGHPEMAVTWKKQRQIIKTANAYIAEKQMEEEARFDIISIVLNKHAMQIEHIEDAFYPVAGKHSL